MSVDAVEYDPFSTDVMTNPYPIYDALRARYRTYRIDAYDAYALPRFDDVWQVLSDREHFSIVEGPVFHRERLLRGNDGPPDTSLHRPVPSFSMLDPPHHTRLRQAMIDPFRPGAVAGLGDAVRALATARLDEVSARGTFDVRHDYASPVSAAVAAQLVGLPPDEGVELVTLVNRYVRREPGQAGFSEHGTAARVEIDERLRAFVADRRRRPAREPGDIIDGLVACRVADGPLDDQEIVDQLVTLFIGGTETLPKVMAAGAYELWRHPDQRAALAADPARIPNAFEEILRHDLPLQFVGRTLLADADIAGQPMRAGQRVVLLLISANRDEREFEDPDRFDADRRMERHLGLGHGAHFCIGAHVARLEGVVMMRELLDRFPEYDVDDSALEREASEFQVGWAEMPIRTGSPRGPR
ncbi:MAG TPA: cytochrome P450 [Acidimicrobiia bacterium]|nr:cytochrome P450 [Acidimicrobiia bacterium]